MLLQTRMSLTQTQVVSLKKLSESSGLPVSELVRRAIDAYLDEIIGTPKERAELEAKQR